ncbi:hypothetical protein BGX34_005130 [Mortierella sp. NVP85]|nr:hypothetical protein BGX34_005130 [Mortierella sp. NVP85]
MSLLCRAGVGAVRSTRVVQKRFGSHASHGPEAPPTHEGFTSGGFKFALISVVGLIAWSRIDEHLTKQGEEKHPLTRYVEYYMRTEEESNRINENHIRLAKQVAQENLMNNASEKCIEVGTTVSTSDVIPKYHN